MTLVWRGAGILVPLIALATALIIAKSTDMESLKGVGLSGIIAGAALLLIGYFTMPGKVLDPETGEKVSKKKHDFFFIPIIVWGALLVIAGVYLMFFK